MARAKQKRNISSSKKDTIHEEPEDLDSYDEDHSREASTTSNKKRKGDSSDNTYDVEYLLEKMRKLEDQLNDRKREPPPVINLPESIDIATLEKFDRHNKVMMAQLKEFASEMVFPRKKFILNKKDATDLCIAAVKKQRVMLPDNTTVQEFAQRYSGTMKTLLHRLIGYAQQIARERYMGKNFEIFVKKL